MGKINYKLLNEKIKPYFLAKYRDFINKQIKEVNDSKYPVDISIYTSKTAQEPNRIVEQFLNDKNIENHSITNAIGSFHLNLDFYLLMQSFDERIKMDHELFHKIFLHNQKLRDKL